MAVEAVPGGQRELNGLLEQAILPVLDQSDLVFVFPSDLAAASALRTSLRVTGRQALPLRRFISWDTFKNLVFAGDAGLRPSSSLLRLLFTRSLLLRNRERAFLSRIVPVEQADASLNFVNHIAKALPALGALEKLCPGGMARRPLVAEWLLIRGEYASFMAQRGLYEAAWETPDAAPGRNRYRLLFPELTDDWHDYAPALADKARFEHVSLPGQPETLSATRFPSVLQEIRAVLLRVRRALDEGIHPSDIQLSVCDFDHIRPALEREARVAGIPLDLREATALSDSAGGRLLGDMLAVATSRCSYLSLRRLLLDQSRPFANPGLIHRLMRLGLDKHILAPLPDLRRDIWLDSMDRRDQELASYYRRLRDLCTELAKASHFGTVRESFDRFRREYLDNEAWTSAQSDELARCLLALEELETTVEELRLGAIPEAAALWLEQLKASPYLAVSRGAGVPVYRFRVSAGCQPVLHCVLNIAEAASRVEARPLPFLRDDERSWLQDGDRDLSEGILRLLTYSGDEVYLSYSEEGPAGIRPPHPALALEDPQAGTANARFLDWDPGTWLPLLDRELARRPDCLPRTCFPGQQAAARAARLGALRNGILDLASGQPDAPAYLPPGLRDSILTRQHRDGTLHLSSSLVESYENCAFRCVFERILKIRREDTRLDFLDNLMIGEFYHNILQGCLAPLMKAGQPVVQAEAGGEQDRPAEAELTPALTAALARFETEHGPFPSLLLKATLPRVRQRLDNTLASLRRLLDGWYPLLTDTTSLYMMIPEAGLRIEGRPDLVCVGRDSEVEKTACLVDYKKNSLPTLRELGLENGSLGRLQIPLYLALLEQADIRVEAAWYVSVEQEGSGKTRQAYGATGKPALQQSDLPQILEAVRQRCTVVADSFRSGAVFTPLYRDLSRQCQNCELRPVCRRHHAVR